MILYRSEIFLTSSIEGNKALSKGGLGKLYHEDINN